MEPISTQGLPAGLGFIGTGVITSAIVRGLCTLSECPFRIVVSPRSASVASDLAQRFSQVSIAGSNQDVLDQADAVFLAVRPQIADEVLRELQFREDHHVVTMIATYARAQIEAMVRPARRVVRAVPQPTVASHRGPTAIFPADPLVAAIFGPLGRAVEVETEREYQMLLTASAAMSSHFACLDAIENWLAIGQVPPLRSREYLAMMFAGLGDVPLNSAASFPQLIEMFQTRGGLNEQYSEQLRAAGVFGHYATALEAVHARIRRAEDK